MSPTLLEALILMDAGAFSRWSEGPQEIVTLHSIVGRRSSSALLTFTEILVILEDKT